MLYTYIGILHHFNTTYGGNRDVTSQMKCFGTEKFRGISDQTQYL